MLVVCDKFSKGFASLKNVYLEQAIRAPMSFCDMQSLNLRCGSKLYNATDGTVIDKIVFLGNITLLKTAIEVACAYNIESVNLLDSVLQYLNPVVAMKNLRQLKYDLSFELEQPFDLNRTSYNVVSCKRMSKYNYPYPKEVHFQNGLVLPCEKLTYDISQLIMADQLVVTSPTINKDARIKTVEYIGSTEDIDNFDCVRLCSSIAEQSRMSAFTVRYIEQDDGTISPFEVIPTVSMDDAVPKDKLVKLIELLSKEEDNS